jgi:hypothetical protein
MTASTLRRTALLALLALAVAGQPAARAQGMHMHQHAGAASANVKLDDGKKWPTEPSLRSGMAAIRTAFDGDHPAIHEGRETDDAYAALAAKVDEQVRSIVKDCHLPAAADANLHYLIADLSQGANLMRGKDPGRTRHDGAALVHSALIAYGKYFDDPAWKP